MSRKKSAYATAGVDIDEQTAGLQSIKKLVASTKTAGVLTGIGPFGGMFRSPGKNSILVASTDGVGTKLTVAKACRKYDTVGQDIVNHCTNDILVQGAEPLFFLDYFATSRLSANVLSEIVKGLATACCKNECALLGGETAEMAGVYGKGEFDLVGTIVGHVNKSKVITGRKIRSKNVIIGLRSSGLHTNGYTLARKALFEKAKLKVSTKLPGKKTTIGKALLAVHKSYLKPVRALLGKVTVHGMAHITGGGFIDNIPRILPGTVDAVIDCSTWRPPVIFDLIQHHGKVDPAEMYRVFNMGIGYVVVVPAKMQDTALSLLRKNGERPVICGTIRKGHGKTILTNIRKPQ